MADEYFEALSAHSINFDAGVRELTETWRDPDQILSGYGADEEQGEANLQELQSEITTLKNDMVNNRRLMEDHISEMDTFIDDTEQQIREMIRSCNEIDTVMSEYGYVPLKQESDQNKFEITGSANSSLVSPEQLDKDLQEVEFTPDMTWRQKPRANTLSGNGEPDPNLVSKLDKLFVNSYPAQE